MTIYGPLTNTKADGINEIRLLVLGVLVQPFNPTPAKPARSRAFGNDRDTFVSRSKSIAASLL